MSHEAAYPETSHTPEAQLFNVGAMSDEQITIVHRGLSALSNEDQGEPYDQMDTNGMLLGYLAADIRDLATRDPERVKSMVQKLAASENIADQELAVNTARGLARYDYPFARDVVCRAIDNPNLDFAGYEASLMMRDDLTPDQINDFRAHIAATFARPLIEPASSDAPDI